MSGPLDLRYMSLALVALAPAVGCGPPRFEALEFEIVAAALDGDTLVLTFSEPLASADQIDPNDFRISAAQSYRWYYGSGSPQNAQGTLYADIGYGYGNAARFGFAYAELGAADEVLVLHMAAPFPLVACDVIAYYDSDYASYVEEYLPGSEFEMGLYLHYARGAIPIESADGARLEDIGPDWVLHPSDVMVVPRYGFPKLDPKLEIPCPRA